jgi:hypothetical protein
MTKTYVGDGVYVRWDPEFCWLELTTENGITVTNRIVLEFDVYVALVAYVDALQRRARDAQEPRE